MQNAELRVCHLILATIKKEYYMLGLHVEFLKKGIKKQLIALFLSAGLQGELEGKKYTNTNLLLELSIYVLHGCRKLPLQMCMCAIPS